MFRQQEHRIVRKGTTLDLEKKAGVGRASIAKKENSGLP